MKAVLAIVKAALAIVKAALVIEKAALVTVKAVLEIVKETLVIVLVMVNLWRSKRRQGKEQGPTTRPRRATATVGPESNGIAIHNTYLTDSTRRYIIHVGRAQYNQAIRNTYRTCPVQPRRTTAGPGGVLDTLASVLDTLNSPMSVSNKPPNRGGAPTTRPRRATAVPGGYLGLLSPVRLS